MSNNFDPAQPIPGGRFNELFDQARSSFGDGGWFAQSMAWLDVHHTAWIIAALPIVLITLFFTTYWLTSRFAKDGRVAFVIAGAVMLSLVVALGVASAWMSSSLHDSMAEFATQPVHDWISWRYGIVVDHNALEEALRVASYGGDSLAGSSHELEGTDYALSFAPISGDVTLVGVNSGHEMMTPPNLASEQ